MSRLQETPGVFEPPQRLPRRGGDPTSAERFQVLLALARRCLGTLIPAVLLKNTEQLLSPLSPLGFAVSARYETDEKGAVHFVLQDHRLIFGMRVVSAARESHDSSRVLLVSTVVTHASSISHRRCSELAQLPVQRLTSFWVEEQVSVFLQAIEPHLQR